VQQTFARVAMLGAENVGWVLFMNIFEIALEAQALFPFKIDNLTVNGPVGSKNIDHTRMKAHAGRVVSTVATAVSLLRSLETLVPVLHSLGLKHVGYGVIPAHYDVVGQALIKSLTTALGEKMTPAVTNAYLKVFTILKNTMLEKCDYSKLVATPTEEIAHGEGDAKPKAAVPKAKPKAKPKQKTQATEHKKEEAAETHVRPERKGENKKVPEPQAKSRLAARHRLSKEDSRSLVKKMLQVLEAPSRDRDALKNKLAHDPDEADSLPLLWRLLESTFSEYGITKMEDMELVLMNIETFAKDDEEIANAMKKFEVLMNTN